MLRPARADDPQNGQPHKTKTEKVIQQLDYLVNRLGVRLKKTKACKHEGSCLSSLLINSIKIGISAYGIKVAAKTLFSISRIFSNPSILKKLLTDQSNIKFGVCLGSFVAIFRILTCSLRRYVQSEQSEKYVFMLAGFLAGIFAAFFLEKGERQAFGLFLIARAIDIIYQSLIKKKYIPENKIFYPLLYSISMVATGYCFINEPGTLSPQTYSFYKNFTNESLAEMQMRQILTQKKNLELLKKGIEPQLSVVIFPKIKPVF